MSQEPLIAIMIHDLNPWSGQNQPMLEIAKQLNKKYPLEIHSFTLNSKDEWNDMHHIPYVPLIKRPIIAKHLNYHLNSWKNLKKSPSTWVQSTGLASLKSDVVQVEFIHHSWQRIKTRLEQEENPGLLSKIYLQVLCSYNLFLEKHIYIPKKKYIAVSHSIKKELMENFKIPAENIEIIYHGVDSKYFYPFLESEEARLKRQELRKKLAIEKSDFLLLHVGGINPRKGLYKSLQVLAEFKKNDIKNVKLLAIGEDHQKTLKKWSDELGVTNRLILAPYPEDMRGYYWAADTFFFPAYYEPFGLSILEAMACGLPTVTSFLAGASELISDQKNGLLFDPNDCPKKIANTLLTVIRDPIKAKSLGKWARQKALERDWTIVGNKYNEFYDSLVRKNKRICISK